MSRLKFNNEINSKGYCDSTTTKDSLMNKYKNEISELKDYLGKNFDLWRYFLNYYDIMLKLTKFNKVLTYHSLQRFLVVNLKTLDENNNPKKITLKNQTLNNKRQVEYMWDEIIVISMKLKETPNSIQNDAKPKSKPKPYMIPPLKWAEDDYEPNFDLGSNFKPVIITKIQLYRKTIINLLILINKKWKD